MQKYTTIIFFFIFCSCGQNTRDKEVELKKQDSLNKEIIKSMNQVLENNCDNSYPEFIFNGGTKNTSFSAICPSDTINDIPMSSFIKKGINNPFDTSIVKIKDSVLYSFKLSNVCCRTYFGGSLAKNDSLFLYYHDCGQSCDCHCDYVLTYKLHKRQFRKKIIIARYK